MPSLKTVLKLGATNLTNQYVVQAYGSPAVGGLYVAMGERMGTLGYVVPQST